MRSIVDRCIALCGACIGAQFPQFVLLYTHRLGGHVRELHHQLSILEAHAHLSAKTLPEWIAKFTTAQDPDFVQQGIWMRELVQRYEYMQWGLQNLVEASVLKKPLAFFQVWDLSIVQDTWHQFQWGFVFNMESFSYAFLGLLFAGACSTMVQFFWDKRKTFSTASRP